MAGKRLRISPADRDERLRRYAELRDQGVLRADAAREAGLASACEGAGAAYERWYCADRGLRPPAPRRGNGPWLL